MSGVNRSLRRKPPPPMDDDEPQNPSNFVPGASESPLTPNFTPEKQVPPFQPPFKTEKKHPQISVNVNADLAHDSDFGNEYDYFNEFAEDSLLSYDSPRPKGPQNLPLDVIDPITPTNNPTLNHACASVGEPNSPLFLRLSPLHDYSLMDAKGHVSAGNLGEDKKISPPNVLVSHRASSYRQRKFQNLLQKGTSPFHVSESDEEISREYFELERGFFLEHETTTLPSQLPYPVLNTFLSDEDDFDEQREQEPENVDTSDRGQVQREPDLTTPTRIPNLAQHDSMRMEQHHPLLREMSSPEIRFLRNSPPRLLNLPSTSPELHLYKYFSSPLSSPTHGSMNGKLPQVFAGIPSDGRSSRSPSPKKFPGTLSNAQSGPYPYEEDYLDVFEDYYNQERVPRWSLIENDDLDYYEDFFVSPRERLHFDYTILPLLPRKAGDILASIPQQPSQLQPALTVRRKNDALPPVPLNLPLLPFLPLALTALHFVACASVWSLSSVFQWCVQLHKWIDGQRITLKEFRKVLMRLIAFHKQDIPIDLISRNVSQIIESFMSNNLLVFDPLEDTDEKQKKTRHFLFVLEGSTSGVLVDLTSCYCTDDDHELPGRRDFSSKCYSSQCMINKTIEHEHLMRTTNIHELVLGSDWASHWKLAAHDMAVDLSETKRQSFLFDLIKFEQNFVQRAECFVDIAGPEFIKSARIMVGSNYLVSMKELEENILSSAKELLSIHKTSLYEPLLKILVADGRFIKNLNGMATLYESWAKAARSPLLTYMSAMPMIEDLLENAALKNWDELVRVNPRMKDVQANGNLLLMSTFNSRYQQLPLQLLDIRKFFDEEDEEYGSLTKAVNAIRQLGSTVNEMKVYSDNVHALRLVERQLAWKSNVFQPRLNLSSARRKFFFRGDLIRKGDLKINSHSAHLIVLDNYLLITEKQRTQKSIVYKVTESPIPLDYLIIENRERESYGLLVKSSSAQGTANTDPKIDEESSSYLFKVRYAGRGKGESHTLIASTEKERKRWISVLVLAKANLLRKVLPVTPYDFELVENVFFAYEPGSKMLKLPILSAADPLSILAKKNSLAFGRSSEKRPLVQLQVRCSYMVRYMSEQFIFLGTDSGVYCSDNRNTWRKIINMNNVTKLTVLQEFNIVLVLASKHLRYYPLQLLINIYYEKKDKITSYQLSNESILFYEFGRHRGLPSLFVAKRKTAGTTAFKVFVMELDNNGIFSTFAVWKRFFMPSECHGISIFNSSIAVHTQKGFEVMDLQNLMPRSIPKLPPPDPAAKKLDGYNRKKGGQSVDVIKKAISHATPMGMFKLSNNKEFLMVYNECAVFVNKSGNLSRTSAIRFDFRPKNIAFAENNLFLVCEEVIEVWSISGATDGTNKLIQVIPSKDLHLLDPLTLSFKLANPDISDLQLVFRMLPRPESPLMTQE